MCLLSENRHSFGKHPAHEHEGLPEDTQNCGNCAAQHSLTSLSNELQAALDITIDLGVPDQASQLAE